MTRSCRVGRVVGVDYGTRRLGFAVSDPTGMLASAHCVRIVRGVKDAAQAVIEICREQEAEKLVLGFPLNMDGSSGPIAEAVQAFRDKLVPRLGIPIELWDERWTSKSAEDALIEAGTRRDQRKQLIDKVAAQIMLQHYLDAQAAKAERDAWDQEQE